MKTTGCFSKTILVDRSQERERLRLPTLAEPCPLDLPQCTPQWPCACVYLLVISEWFAFIYALFFSICESFWINWTLFRLVSWSSSFFYHCLLSLSFCTTHISETEATISCILEHWFPRIGTKPETFSEGLIAVFRAKHGVKTFIGRIDSWHARIQSENMHMHARMQSENMHMHTSMLM